jgi:hypothetical protein
MLKTAKLKTEQILEIFEEIKESYLDIVDSYTDFVYNKDYDDTNKINQLLQKSSTICKKIERLIFTLNFENKKTPNQNLLNAIDSVLLTYNGKNSEIITKLCEFCKSNPPDVTVQHINDDLYKFSTAINALIKFHLQGEVEDIVTSVEGYPLRVVRDEQKYPTTEQEIAKWDENENIIKRLIESIRLGIKQIKNHGLGFSLDKYFKSNPAEIIIYTKGDPGMGGMFLIQEGNIIIYPHALNSKNFDAVYAFCHEFGHAYYFRHIGNVGKELWKQEVENTKISSAEFNLFTLIFIDFIKSQMNKKIKQLFSSKSDADKKDLTARIESSCKSEIEKRKVLKILSLLNIDLIYPRNITYSGYDNNAVRDLLDYAFDYLTQQLNIFKYSLEEDLTDYATTHPDETFAEAFAMYVCNGPQSLPPKTRANMVKMMEAGGAREVKKASVKKRIKYFKLMTG